MYKAYLHAICHEIKISTHVLPRTYTILSHSKQWLMAICEFLSKHRNHVLGLESGKKPLLVPAPPPLGMLYHLSPILTVVFYTSWSVRDFGKSWLRNLACFHISWKATTYFWFTDLSLLCCYFFGPLILACPNFLITLRNFQKRCRNNPPMCGKEKSCVCRLCTCVCVYVCRRSCESSYLSPHTVWLSSPSDGFVSLFQSGEKFPFVENTGKHSLKKFNIDRIHKFKTNPALETVQKKTTRSKFYHHKCIQLRRYQFLVLRWVNLISD